LWRERPVLKKFMKLIYITNNRLPTEKAHGIQIAKMCESFAKQGVDLELVYPKRRNKIEEDFFGYYNIKKDFKLTKLWCLDLTGIIPKIGFRLQSITFAKSAYLYLLFKKYKGLIYSRDQFSSMFLSLNNKIVFELHSLPKNIKFHHRYFLKRMYKIIAISQGLKNDLIKLGIPKDKILTAPDGVDLKNFKKIKESKKELRKELDLPFDKKIVLYTGHLYKWKGVYILAQAANDLPGDYLIVFVGGTEHNLGKFKKFIKDNNLKNILLLGHKKNEVIPQYLKSADVLILPNSGKERISSHYTSPMKLFEYMASGVPIVASDLPSIREILNKNNSVLVGADNPGELSNGIKNILQNKELADRISKQAREEVKNYIWEKRAKKILDFISDVEREK